jgi:predicted glycosyltransferase
MSRALIHVQHLLGTGHARRAAAIGAALAASGIDTEIVSGGTPIAGLETGKARLTQLPPLRTADATFKHLLDGNGRAVDDMWKAARRDALLARFHALQPDILITELFPFGRRLLEFELLPLIEAARASRPRPLIYASLRDVLVAPSDPRKAERAIERVRAWYDGVLVHGDPSLIDLPASFPAARGLANIHYTGYVAPAPTPAAPPDVGENEVVVSAGGSAVGARLLETALAAHAAGCEAGRVWRLLVGADLPRAMRERLNAASGPALIVESARRDFPDLLRRCHVSVSQGGYNTVMDILDSQCRAVLVPIAAGGETEQAQRAEALAARGWAQVVDESTLTAATLADAINRAGRMARPETATLKRDGAAESARLLKAALARVSA